MPVRFILVLFILGYHTVFGQVADNISTEPIKVEINLKSEHDRAVPVQITLPSDLQKPLGRRDVLRFQFPKTIPGTYTILDYGRFISHFTVTDPQGQLLDVEQTGINTWEISARGRVRTPHTIRYNAHSTFTTPVDSNLVIEPAGTLFERNHAYVINHSGLIGFFDNGENRPYELVYVRPEEMYGATTLPALSRGSRRDTYYAPSYHFLVDNPLMYCIPDTVNMNVGNVRVTVATCSRGSLIRSRFIANEISDILFAIEDYFGGVLPVDRYAFLIYINDGMYQTRSYGALEHSYSSLYTLMDFPAETISDIMKRFVAHEFFHIITPLNIKSEAVKYFDYMNPQMDSHLWMYEGVTEYKSGLVLYTGGMYDLDEFFSWIGSKMRDADRFRSDVPLTKLSRYCLDKYSDQFYSFYNRGALVGLSLDLKLISLSGGTMNLMDLMDRLSIKYGRDKAFKDDELFDAIGEAGFHELKAFLELHVADTVPLPISELLSSVGVVYDPTVMLEEVSVGFTPRDINYDGEFFYLARGDGLNSFGEAMGFEVGDIIKKWNHKEVTLMTINEIFGAFIFSAKPGDALHVVVERDGTEIELQGIVLPVKVERNHGIRLDEHATDEQKALRSAWLRKR